MATTFRSNHWQRFYKISFLENFAKSQENNCIGVAYKIAGLKGFHHKCFSLIFPKLSTHFIAKHLSIKIIQPSYIGSNNDIKVRYKSCMSLTGALNNRVFSARLLC